MGTFSIWHWLIVLSFLAANVVPIKLARKDKTLPRLPYLFRFLILVTVGVILGLLNTMSDSSEYTLSPAMLPVIFATIVATWILSILWAVHRTQDIGWPKWWCLLLLVPAVNLIYLLALLLWPGRILDRQQEASF